MTHQFERAGLGSRPFRVLRTERKVFSIPGVEGSSRPGSSCDYCGTAITNVWWVCGSAATDREFKVGCDCVYKVDPKLYAELQAFRRAERAELRAMAARARETREAERRSAERAATAERNEAAFALFIEGALLVASSERCSSFERDVAQRAADGLIEGTAEFVSDLEWATVRRGVILATAPESKPFGKPGERLRDVRARFIGGPVVGEYSPYGPRLLAKFVLDTGEILLWPTSAFGRHPTDHLGRGYSPTVGDWNNDRGRREVIEFDECLLTATIEQHETYNGTVQTRVSRAKVRIQ